jgi:pyruvate ferredoxin oxidoreductase alpha subunit
MGSVAGTVKEVVDELRAQGQKVGVVRLITYRPFPKEAVYQVLRDVREIIAIEKAISLGSSGPLATEIRSLFQGRPANPRISGFVAGLGGRDITMESIKTAISKAQLQLYDADFIDLREDMELEGING